MSIKLLTVVLWTISFFLISCGSSYSYPKDAKVSTPEGIAADSSVRYFPPDAFNPRIYDGKKLSFANDWYSSILHASQEPVLSNFFIGKEVYRLLWVPSFSPPTVVTLYRDERTVWLTAKKLDREPAFYPRLVRPEDIKGEYELYNKRLINDSTIEILADRKGNLVYDTTVQLTVKDWARFEAVLREGNFWSANQEPEKAYTDGCTAIWEAHSQGKYRYVDVDLFNDHLRKAGEMLFSWGGLKYACE